MFYCISSTGSRLVDLQGSRVVDLHKWNENIIMLGGSVIIISLLLVDPPYLNREFDLEQLFCY